MAKIYVKYIFHKREQITGDEKQMRHRRSLAALAVMLVLALGAAQAEIYVPSYTYAAIDETNVERARYGLGTLRVDEELMAAARVRAGEIAQKFSHTRPDGTMWRTVSGAAYGENIARGHNNPDRVTAAWMSSNGHRQNILKASYGSIGVACVKEGNIYYWVQLFGK